MFLKLKSLMVSPRSSCSTLNFTRRWRRKEDRCAIQSISRSRISKKDIPTWRIDSKGLIREMQKSLKILRKEMRKESDFRNCRCLVKYEISLGCLVSMLNYNIILRLKIF